VSAPVPDVRSAGGVVWRGTGTRREVMLVYRDRYGDWSLPKGKLEPGEAPLCAAVREVLEETGIAAVPQVRLPTVHYLTGTPGESKSVDFWAMRAVDDAGRDADDEISEARWVAPADAPALLTYAHDRGVLHAFSRLPGITAELFLVRHAHAGDRHRFAGPDEQRPLSRRGRAEVERLTPVLRLIRPVRVVSASVLRCRETVAGLGVPVELRTALDETSPAGLPGARETLLALARDAQPAVVCSQGKVIPPLLASLRPPDWPLADGFETAKGTGWLLGFAGDRLVALDRVP
jgi:8-oxo-dGTP pyrophosphatase MutT (NUDIX family)